MVQVTAQSYRRSLQEFSESPIMSRCKSLSSSHSLTGAPQSITEYLALWENDPVEILLDLGFGIEEPDVCTKIPPRFLSGASVAKGINIRVFLEAQKQRMDIERSNLHERFRQLEVLDHVTSALSSLLADVNAQQIKALSTGEDETCLLEAAKSSPVVTRAKRRMSQLLKRASRPTVLVKQGSLAPGNASLPSRKEQPCSCTDTVEKGTVQVGFSACVTLDCLTQEQTLRDKGTSAYPTSQCPPIPSRTAWVSSHLATEQCHLSPACEMSAKDRPRKELLLPTSHALKKGTSLNCKLPDSFEMEEIQSFEDESLCGNAPDTTSAEAMVTRTSSCQSDSSGFMEELPEAGILQNASLLGEINFISDIQNQETALSHGTGFPMLNWDFQQKSDDCIAKFFITACETVLAMPRSMKTCSDQGENTNPLLTAGNGKYQACNAEPQNFVQEMLCDMDKKEDKTERKRLEKEKYIKEHRPCFRGDTQDEGDPSSSKFDCHLCFSRGDRKTNVTFTELSDINPAVICESKIRGEDEGESCWIEKDIGVACHESGHGAGTGYLKGQWWGVEVVSKDSTPFAVNKATKRQKFCKMHSDSKYTRCSPKKGLPETLQWSSAPQSGISAASSCSMQVPQKHLSCLAEGPGLSSSKEQETGSIEEMLGADKSEQEDTVQNSEMASAPLKSVTVQMSSGLEFLSIPKGERQNACLSYSLAREDPVDFSDMLAHCSEGGPLIQSDPGALTDSVQQTTKASSQTNDWTPRQLPLLCLPHTHLTKSASLDSVLCGKHRSCYWSEASGTGCVQGGCCCHCYCPWTFPTAASPQCSVGCCSSCATSELELFKTLVLLQDTAKWNSAPCTLHEIEAMKHSCQHFQEKLDEIEQHLIEQQALFSSAMTDEGREEGRYLQFLRQAVRQEVAELEFQLNDRAFQVRESILMQLDQLLAEQSHLFSELGLSDWKGERKTLNKQAFPDAADTEHPQSGCSKVVLQRAPSKHMTATSLHSALQLGTSPIFPTGTAPEPNSVDSVPWVPSISKRKLKDLLKQK
ncbi:protein ITPRID1 [Colius striatus]|uniref:protein ITPRID1 n=1 Tax=Colius striatus TaxID=57412 RepID=UPI002B1CFB07|nr:protein ITPRID1 [Colius striatus]